VGLLYMCEAMLHLRDLAVILAFGAAATAQTFSIAGNTATVQPPASRVLNYTTVNITGNCTVNFQPKVPNAAVTHVYVVAVGCPGSGRVLRSRSRT
jgi:hypothetical protein